MSAPLVSDRTPSEPVVAGAAALSGRQQADWPRVTVAILAFNRCDAVRITLSKTLSELDYPSDALDVILVDNASTDGTAKMVAEEFPTVRLMHLERNVGMAGINQAFAAAQGKWCLALDDDCWIDGPSLKLAVAAAEANRADLVTFRVRSSKVDGYFFTNSGLLSFWGCAALISHRALSLLDGYDPFIFIWNNELEFTMRFLNAGLRHLFLRDVTAVHMKSPTTEFQPRAHTFALRHAGYAAAKLLSATDAARVIGRLMLVITLDVVAQAPMAVRSFPALVEGVRAGLRARQPIRPEVSAVYRDNFTTFFNPLRFLRTPRERLASWRRSGARAKDDGEMHWEAFRQARPRYFPEETALLQL